MALRCAANPAFEIAMNELFFFVLGLLVLTLLVAPTVFSIIAWGRTRRLGRRVEQLEADLASRPGGTAQRPAPTRAPAPAPQPPVADPEPIRAEPGPAPATPVPATPAPVAPAPKPVVAELLASKKPASEGTQAKEVPGARAEPRPSIISRLSEKLASIEWERWIGMRGAALLGAVFLALAGILLFQYSIQKNLITPEMRIGMGLFAGVAGLIGAEILRKKTYTLTANGLAAGSVVVLYASFWAGHAVLHLYALKVAFVAMAVVTALCCALSSRNRSQLIAVLGLLGGFATPLVLMSSLDNPVGLFGYILLLDLGFVFIGRRRGWSSMGLVGIVGTALIQVVWMGRSFDAEHLTFGLAVLGIFAVLFAVGGSGEIRQRRRWFLSQASGVLMPFLFAAYFATRVEIGPYLLPLAGLAALLSLAACWVARKESASWLPLGAASGTVALVMVWLFSTQPALDGPRAPLLVGVTLGLALLFHVFVELEKEKARNGFVAAAAFANGGMLLALIFAGVFAVGTGVWPWIAGFVAILLINVRLTSKGGVAALQLAGGLGLALGLSSMHAARATDGSFPSVEGYFAVLLSGCLLLGVLAAARRTASGKRWAWISAAVYTYPVIPLLGLTPRMFDAGPLLVLGSVGLLGLFAVFASSRVRSSLLFGVALVVTAVFQMNWVGDHFGIVENADQLFGTLLLLLATATGFLFAPALLRKAFLSTQHGLQWVSRLATVGVWWWYAPAQALYERHFGDEAMGVLPLLFAVPVALAAFVLMLRDGEERALQTSRAWYLATAMGFACLALPLQLDEKAVLVALSLFGLGAAVLWRWRRYNPLLFPSVISTTLSTALLLVTAMAPRAFRASDALFVNWISYAYLVPAAATLVTTWLLVSAPEDLVETFAKRFKGVRAIAGFAAVALVFAWISLTIFNAWETGEWVVVTFRRLQTRDLILSISWAVYALGLLGLGMGRRIGALRWLSLGLLLVTIGKVFLFDLGNLEGLHRVGSMFGLAVSLLLVSFLYQRFVFRAARTA
jgi:uncharacterized membrane protein